MIPFDQQLRAIVTAISFVSPQHTRVTNLNGAQRCLHGGAPNFGSDRAALQLGVEIEL